MIENETANEVDDVDNKPQSKGNPYLGRIEVDELFESAVRRGEAKIAALEIYFRERSKELDIETLLGLAVACLLEPGAVRWKTIDSNGEQQLEMTP